MPRISRISLTDKEKDFIFKQMGCNFPDCVIQKSFQTEFKRPISSPLLSYHRHNDLNQAKINKYRRQFENHVTGVELASKRRRVEELDRIYHILFQKQKYESAMRSLQQIQIELEGHGKTENNYNYNQYINLSNDEIKQKLFENAKKLLEIEERKKLDVKPLEEGRHLTGIE